MEYDPEESNQSGEYTKRPLKSVSEIRLGSIVNVLHQRRIAGGALTSKQKQNRWPIYTYTVQYMGRLMDQLACLPP